MSGWTPTLAPEGYRLIEWWTSQGGINTQVRMSKTHLTRADDPKDKRTLCGRKPGRGANVSRPTKYDPNYHDHGLCSTCFKRAAA